ncbi:MAG: U32 family peptidase [Magnetococcales bacterium]|nr:U32 family peptidase [Magnetococcales bacterium]
MKIAIGPVLFDWNRETLNTFYRRMAFESAADIIYIGEVVCSKRVGLGLDGLAQLLDEIIPSGKEIVLSSYGLVMHEGELETIQALADMARERGLMLEANDMAAVGLHEGCAMVAGPHINTYNPETVDILKDMGARRAVFPVELPCNSIASIIDGYRDYEQEAAEAHDEREEGGEGDLSNEQKPFEFELFAHGRLPLTFSARCYTARAFDLPKSDCHFKCGDYPDGMKVKTQDGVGFLTINGVETMSDPLHNLIGHVDQIRQAGVDIVRLSPQQVAGADGALLKAVKERGETVTEHVAALWRRAIDGDLSAVDAVAMMNALTPGVTFCNGYFLDQPGVSWIPPE